jgi:DNA-binding transcriptional ArsR family regulator
MGQVSVTIDVTGLAADDYLFAPSPLAELGSALHVIAEPAHHPTRSGWVNAMSAALDPELLERIIDMDFLWRTSRADMFLPSVPEAQLAAELDTVDRLDDESWVNAALITSSCGTIALHREFGSPLVDPRACDLALERSAARGPRARAFVEFILEQPVQAREKVRRLLEDCERAFFDHIWRRVVVDLQADARLKRDLLAGYGLERALSAVSSAVTLNGSSTRIVVDKLQDNGTSARGRGVTFLPSAFGHPHLMVVHAPGWTPVIQYPAAGSAITDVLPLDDVERRLHALDSPIRLRLVRSLARGQRTTAELADIWRLTAPEVSRHLAVLREAGIISAVRRGRYVLYDLDQVAVARLGVDMIDALLR